MQTLCVWESDKLFKKDFIAVKALTTVEDDITVIMDERMEVN